MNSDFLSILLIAVGLSADCFAVALGASTQITKHFRLQVLRISISFGLFQALMPVLGWLAGKTVIELIENYDHWVAFALLVIVGVRMVWESFRSKENHERGADITRWFMLLTLSIATSIDALAIGLSFAFLNVSIILASMTIGLVSLLVTSIGLILGKKASRLIGKRAEVIGGIILLAIAFRILLTHILQ